MTDEFRDRVVVITGASSGIGEACARRFAADGARVFLFARRAERLQAIANAIGERAVVVPGDVASEADIARLFSLSGDCDVLVNNAGMIDPKPLVETTAQEWERMFSVNVHGAYLATRIVLPSMIRRRRGAIVNVSSISGVPGPEKFAGWVSYCASKAAVIAMTEALAVEVKEHGVRVNAVSPGSVDTPMWAEASGGAPASMTADEVAESILFLASERSRPMNGQNLWLW